MERKFDFNRYWNWGGEFDLCLQVQKSRLGGSIIDSRPFGGTCACLGRKVPAEFLVAHVLGDHAEEVINIFGLAIRNWLTALDLKTMIYAYPTSCSDVSYMV